MVPRRTVTRGSSCAAWRGRTDHRPPPGEEAELVVVRPRLTIADRARHLLQEVHPRPAGIHQPGEHVGELRRGSAGSAGRRCGVAGTAAPRALPAPSRLVPDTGTSPPSRSRTVTSWPSRANDIADVNPMTPPPHTTTSAITTPVVTHATHHVPTISPQSPCPNAPDGAAVDMRSGTSHLKSCRKSRLRAAKRGVGNRRHQTVVEDERRIVQRITQSILKREQAPDEHALALSRVQRRRSRGIQLIGVILLICSRSRASFGRNPSSLPASSALSWAPSPSAGWPACNDDRSVTRQ